MGDSAKEINDKIDKYNPEGDPDQEKLDALFENTIYYSKIEGEDLVNIIRRIKEIYGEIAQKLYEDLRDGGWGKCTTPKDVEDTLQKIRDLARKGNGYPGPDGENRLLRDAAQRCLDITATAVADWQSKIKPIEDQAEQDRKQKGNALTGYDQLSTTLLKKILEAGRSHAEGVQEIIKRIATDPDAAQSMCKKLSEQIQGIMEDAHNRIQDPCLRDVLQIANQTEQENQRKPLERCREQAERVRAAMQQAYNCAAAYVELLHPDKRGETEKSLCAAFERILPPAPDDTTPEEHKRAALLLEKNLGDFSRIIQTVVRSPV